MLTRRHFCSESTSSTYSLPFPRRHDSWHSWNTMIQEHHHKIQLDRYYQKIQSSKIDTMPQNNLPTKSKIKKIIIYYTKLTHKLHTLYKNSDVTLYKTNKKSMFIYKIWYNDNTAKWLVIWNMFTDRVYPLSGGQSNYVCFENFHNLMLLRHEMNFVDSTKMVTSTGQLMSSFG